MTENIEVTQKAGIGSETTQIGVQNVNYGLSPNDAMNMAFEMFRQHYPQLRQEALAEIGIMLEEKLKEKLPQNIVQPSPRIVVPAILNTSITEESDIRELYANLLANSMDSVVKNDVHPAFVEVISQLSPDEAKILKYMSDHTRIPTITLNYVSTNGGTVPIEKDYTDVPLLVDCEQPFQSEKYIDNLVRLGLIRRATLSSLQDKQGYEKLKNNAYILARKEEAEQIIEITKTNKIEIFPFSSTSYTESFIELTALGKSFCQICI